MSEDNPIRIKLVRKESSQNYGFTPYFQGNIVDRPLDILCIKKSLTILWKRSGFEDIKAIYPITSNTVIIGTLPVEKIVKILTIEDICFKKLSGELVPIDNEDIQIKVDGCRLTRDNSFHIPLIELKQKVVDIHLAPHYGCKDFSDRGVLNSLNFPITIIAEQTNHRYTFRSQGISHSTINIQIDILGKDYLEKSLECPIKGFDLLTPIKGDGYINQIVPSRNHVRSESHIDKDLLERTRLYVEPDIMPQKRVIPMAKDQGNIACENTNQHADKQSEALSAEKKTNYAIWIVIFLMIAVITFGIVYFAFPRILGLQPQSSLLDSSSYTAINSIESDITTEKDIENACDYLDNSSVWSQDKMENNKALKGFFEALTTLNWNKIEGYQIYLNGSKKFRNIKDVISKIKSIEQESGYKGENIFQSKNTLLYSEYITFLEEYYDNAKAFRSKLNSHTNIIDNQIDSDTIPID
ncbi:hypothetical protein [Falsiporphyromonas endometrii]|uniref:Uncharacterized protein n=1 Tax=Falsiporphyromonas endometrii TaxID=1387297 RepID=A0ABV9K5X6_9PORP